MRWKQYLGIGTQSNSLFPDAEAGNARGRGGKREGGEGTVSPIVTAQRAPAPDHTLNVELPRIVDESATTTNTSGSMHSSAAPVSSRSDGIAVRGEDVEDDCVDFLEDDDDAE